MHPRYLSTGNSTKIGGTRRTSNFVIYFRHYFFFLTNCSFYAVLSFSRNSDSCVRLIFLSLDVDVFLSSCLQSSSSGCARYPCFEKSLIRLSNVFSLPFMLQTNIYEHTYVVFGESLVTLRYAITGLRSNTVSPRREPTQIRRILVQFPTFRFHGVHSSATTVTAYLVLILLKVWFQEQY